MSVSGRARLVEHLRLPLHRDGYALAANSAFTAVTGWSTGWLPPIQYARATWRQRRADLEHDVPLPGIAGTQPRNVVVRFLPEAGPPHRALTVIATRRRPPPP
jgi:hypothetical protein